MILAYHHAAGAFDPMYWQPNRAYHTALDRHGPD